MGRPSALYSASFRGSPSAALSGLADIESFLLSPDLPAHAFRIDNHTGEPEIRLRVFLIIWIHFYRKTQLLECFLIPEIDCLFLSDVFFQMGELSPDYSGDHIAHPIVVAQFLVLIPWSVFPWPEWTIFLPYLPLPSSSVSSIPPEDPVIILFPLKEIAL